MATLRSFDMNDWFCYPNRTLCDTLEEMRQIMKLSDENTTLRTLVEEAQTYANRMECAMSDWKDVREAHAKKKELKEEIAELKKELKDLEKRKGKK